MRSRALVLPLLLANAGCVRGLVYHNVTLPLVANMDHTPVGEDMASLDTREVKIPRVRLSAAWRSRAIGDAAQRGGLEDLYYADLKNFSLLFGTWRQREVQAWGRARAHASSESRL